MSANDQSLRFRTASFRDIAAIDRIVRDAYAPLVSIVGAEAVAAAYDAPLAPWRTVLVLDGGQLAGLIQTQIFGRQLLIDNLAVLPVYQGKGYGRALMEQAERAAREARLQEMSLWAISASTSTIDFYHRLGFVEHEQKAFLNNVAVRMSRPLAGTTNPVCLDPNRLSYIS